MNVKRWWGRHEGWAAALFLALGSAALGYVIATANCTYRINHIRDHQAQETSRLTDSYTEAMNAKDQLINELARRTEQAAAKATQAAAKATQAAAKVSDSQEKTR